MPWLEPRTEALVGIILQIGGGTSLLLGLGSRIGGLAVVVLGVVAQIYYFRLDTNLFWIAFGAGYVLRGPGPLSLDNLLVKGIARSPLPLAAPTARLFVSTRSLCTAVYRLGIRAWLMLALLLAGGLVPSRVANAAESLSGWVPSDSAAAMFGSSAALLALPLGFGLATRLIAVCALSAAGYSDMVLANTSLSTYWTLALALLLTRGAGSISLDDALSHVLKKRTPQLDGKPAFRARAGVGGRCWHAAGRVIGRLPDPSLSAGWSRHSME